MRDKNDKTSKLDVKEIKKKEYKYYDSFKERVIIEAIQNLDDWIDAKDLFGRIIMMSGGRSNNYGANVRIGKRALTLKDVEIYLDYLIDNNKVMAREVVVDTSKEVPSTHTYGLDANKMVVKRDLKCLEKQKS